jgi:DDE domain
MLDETYIKVAGRWTYLYRAIDQHGQVIDVMLSERRDLAAARRFFTRALRAGTIPAEVITDRAPAYPRVLDELIPSALHTVERYANNPVETDHRAAETPAAADARPEAPPVRADPGRRSRVRLEPPPRPLRARLDQCRHPRREYRRRAWRCRPGHGAWQQITPASLSPERQAGTSSTWSRPTPCDARSAKPCTPSRKPSA